MDIKKWAWKIAKIIVMAGLLLNPELMSLVLFIDAIGIDLFLLLVEVQIVAISGYYFHTWIKPILMPLYKTLLRVDPYFFIPTRDSVAKYPLILCHAVPFLMLFIIGGIVVKPVIDSV